jgi:hypothetical protein
MDNEILHYSYWEHFKWAKELSLVLPLDHPKRIRVEKELNNILDQINANK